MNIIKNNKRIKRILILIAVFLIAAFLVTACGGRLADASRDAKQSEPEGNKPQDEAKDDVSAITADAEAHTVHLNSTASRGPGYVSVNETFTDQKGNSCGKSFSENYGDSLRYSHLSEWQWLTRHHYTYAEKIEWLQRHGLYDYVMGKYDEKTVLSKGTSQ